jgi:hypothetical protein
MRETRARTATPYAMPSYSLRPTMVMSTSALVMDVDWLKKL